MCLYINKSTIEGLNEYLFIDKNKHKHQIINHYVDIQVRALKIDKSRNRFLRYLFIDKLQ